MADPMPPGRSLVSARVVDGGVEVTCDCATATLLVFTVDPGASGRMEHAFTCDGCLSVHWFVVDVAWQDAP